MPTCLSSLLSGQKIVKKLSCVALFQKYASLYHKQSSLLSSIPELHEAPRLGAYDRLQRGHRAWKLSTRALTSVLEESFLFLYVQNQLSGQYALLDDLRGDLFEALLCLPQALKLQHKADIHQLANEYVPTHTFQP
jgi:hypothetical protein